MNNILTTMSAFAGIAGEVLRNYSAVERYAARKNAGTIQVELLDVSDTCLDAEVFTPGKPSYRVTISPRTADCSCPSHTFRGRAAGNDKHICVHVVGTLADATRLLLPLAA